MRRRAPRHWPLSPRVVTNSEERKIWRWLNLAFLDHSVMIKMPVTRFTMPNSRKQGLHWYELLSGLYCTFTIVRPDGHVIGCVDLPGRFTGPPKAQRMKEELLRQCGIAYIVVEPRKLPHLLEIRASFLGEDARAMPDGNRQAAAISAASISLRNSLTRSRQTRNSDLAPLAAREGGPDSVNSDFADSRFAAGWQENSFIMPLDSRSAGLGRAQGS